MTATDRAKQFVNRYPNMFTEDKEWWAATIASEMVSAQQDVLREMRELTGIADADSKRVFREITAATR